MGLFIIIIVLIIIFRLFLITYACWREIVSLAVDVGSIFVVVKVDTRVASQVLRNGFEKCLKDGRKLK